MVFIWILRKSLVFSIHIFNTIFQSKIDYNAVSSFSAEPLNKSNEWSWALIESTETKNWDFGILSFDMISFQGWPNFIYTTTNTKSTRPAQITTTSKTQENQLILFNSSGKNETLFECFFKISRLRFGSMSKVSHFW